MKVLIFGGNGMLGHKLVQSWQNEFDVYTTIRKSFAELEHLQIFERNKTFDNVEVTNFDLVAKIIDEVKPNAIVNAVGIIKQLPTSKNIVKALEINSIFPHKLAEISQAKNIRFITISTDCVFNGKKGNYTEDDISDAEDVYGKSKYLGEVTGENCLTIRTSIIGREIGTSHSLVDWFLSNEGKQVKGFTKAIYTGFPTVVLAEIIADILKNQPNLSGLYQISSNLIDKFSLLKIVREAYNANIEIESDADFQIDRSLNCDKFKNATGFKPKSWEVMIRLMADDSNKYDFYDEK
ncbi:MAG: SDR family oxidoreductase [Pyrinomonadaceae bacterium]|nr:SDR family oxidoreductase [Pyrinomonadaceae bacterium]